MKVTKVAEFTPEELETLKAAGGILGAVAKSIAAGEIDALDETATKMVAALKEVLTRI